MQFSFKDFKLMVEQHLLSTLPNPNDTCEVKVLPSGYDYTVRITDNLTDSQYKFSLLPYYKRYQTGIALSFLMDEISNKVMELTGIHVDYSTLSCMLNDWYKAKPHITMSLMSGRNFRHYHLEQTHPQACISNTDMYLLFCLNVPSDSYNSPKSLTTTVTNQIMNDWGIDTETLLTAARENTPSVMPAEFMWLEESLTPTATDNLGSDAMQAISKTMLIVHVKDTAPNGAVAILYNNIRQKITQVLGTNDFYVIPSNIHEIMCLPKSFAPLDDVLAQVKSINSTIVDDNDFLADDIFEFNQNGILVSATKPESDITYQSPASAVPAYAYVFEQ